MYGSNRKVHYSRMGKEVDVQAIISKHQNVRALGNANMNARGDVLGQDGKIRVTREEIDRSVRQRQEAQMVQRPGGVAAMPDVFETPEEAVKRIEQSNAQTQARIDAAKQRSAMGLPPQQGELINVAPREVQGAPLEDVVPGVPRNAQPRRKLVEK